MSHKSQEKNMRKLAELLGQDLSYIWGDRESGPNGAKKQFLNTGKAFLRALSKDLGLRDAIVSSNPGGIAVSGESTLIGMWQSNGLYVQISQPCCDRERVLLYRTVTVRTIPVDATCTSPAATWRRCLTRTCCSFWRLCGRRAPMSGQPDAVPQVKERSYAIEELRLLQSEIPQLTQFMVLCRAHVEQYRTRSDLVGARDTYSELQRVRQQLADALGSAQLLLMEAEEYQLAVNAGQLREGLLGFNLLSNVYRPVYDALNGFAAQLPVDGTTNAQVVGRLMNNIKLGYYPTDPDNISLILRGVQFPEGVTTNLLDPCCGCGRALRQIANGNNCYTYGVELDSARADEAQTRLHRVGFGSFFFSQVSGNAFHLLFLNPPYLSVLNESGGRARHEKRFLIESLGALTMGGLLVYVIPYYRLTPDVCRVLVDNFENLGLWRFTDAEFKKFKQVAVMGVRKARDAEPKDTQWLEWFAAHPGSIPCLTELPEGRYVLPGRPLEVRIFRGENFNEKELERQLSRSDSFRQMMARSELDSGVKRPPLPLSISQIGLIGGSGMINGLIECDTPHIIKGRIVKVTRNETEEHYSPSGTLLSTELRETITNKMIFNILTPKGFKALT